MAAITGTISIANYPLVPGATTAIQPVGITAPTFSTPPVAGETDIITYTNSVGRIRTFQYRPTEMDASSIIQELKDGGTQTAFLDRYGRLVFPGGGTLTGTGTSAAYLGF